MSQDQERGAMPIAGPDRRERMLIAEQEGRKRCGDGAHRNEVGGLILHHATSH